MQRQQITATEDLHVETNYIRTIHDIHYYSSCDNRCQSNQGRTENKLSTIQHINVTMSNVAASHSSIDRQTGN